MFDPSLYYELALHRGDELIAEAASFRIGRRLRPRLHRSWTRRQKNRSAGKRSA
ncbi:MAG: hypothetical protein JXA67_18365 [Micromonosporaceae bacterium]|nr:hypothetical protein [Micromonosporaceae bacterium]